MRAHLLAAGFAALLPTVAHAQEPDRRAVVNPVTVWAGERDELLPEVTNGVVLDTATWQRFWKYANLPGPCPKVDFTRDVVVVASHTGWSRIYGGHLRVGADGAASTEWVTQPQRIAGSYGIIVVPRAGITSINGRTVGGKL